MRTKRTWLPSVISDQHHGCAQQVLSRTGCRTDTELVLCGPQGLNCLRMGGSLCALPIEPSLLESDPSTSPQAPGWVPVSPCLYWLVMPSYPHRLAFPCMACLRAFAQVIPSACHALSQSSSGCFLVLWVSAHIPPSPGSISITVIPSFLHGPCHE